MKYKEDQILDEIKKYIESTYTEHYSTTEDGFLQVQDMLRHLGIDKDFAQMQSNILLDIRKTVRIEKIY